MRINLVYLIINSVLILSTVQTQTVLKVIFSIRKNDELQKFKFAKALFLSLSFLLLFMFHNSDLS